MQVRGSETQVLPTATKLVEYAVTLEPFATVAPHGAVQDWLVADALHVNDTWVDGLQAHWFAFVAFAVCTHHW